jgi:hypothetical protein
MFWKRRLADALAHRLARPRFPRYLDQGSAKELLKFLYEAGQELTRADLRHTRAADRAQRQPRCRAVTGATCPRVD